MVASHVIGRDRTYYSAVALRDWFHKHNMNVQSFNIVAESTHARRTWLLFQEAFGDEVKVGVIAIQNPDYDPKLWWRSSDGFRDVIGEGIAYFYAKFLFHPLDASSTVEPQNRSATLRSRQSGLLGESTCTMPR
jgi:hypothetical protein